VLSEGSILDGLRIMGHVAANRFGDLHAAVADADAGRKFFVQKIAASFVPTPEWEEALRATTARAASQEAPVFLRVRAPSDGALWVAWEDLDGPNLSDIIGPGGSDNMAKLAWFKRLLEAIARSLQGAAESGVPPHEISLAPEHVQIAFQGAAPPLRELQYTSTEQWPAFEVRLLPLCLDYLTADFLLAENVVLSAEHLRRWLETPLPVRYAALIYGLLTRACSVQGCPPAQFRPVILGTGGNRLNAALRAMFSGKIETVQLSNPRALTDPLALLGEFIPTTAAAPPNAPALRSAAARDGTVALEWTDVRQEENFVVEREGGDGQWKEIAVVPKDTIAYEHRDAGLGSWRYRIVATNAAGRSKPSNAVAVTVRAPDALSITSLDALVQGSARVQLAWRASGAAASRFELQRKRTGTDAWRTIAEPNGSGTSHADTSFARGGTYDYRIRILEPAQSEWFAREGVSTPRGGGLPRAALVAAPLILAGGAAAYFLTRPEPAVIVPPTAAPTPASAPVTAPDPQLAQRFTALIESEASIGGLGKLIGDIESAPLSAADQSALLAAARSKLAAAFAPELDRLWIVATPAELPPILASLRQAPLTDAERGEALRAFAARADPPLQTARNRIAGSAALAAAFTTGEQLWALLDAVTKENADVGKTLGEKANALGIFERLADLLEADGRARDAQTHYKHAIALGSATAPAKLAELYRVLQVPDLPARRTLYDLGIARGDPKAMARLAAFDDGMRLTPAEKTDFLARAEAALARLPDDMEAVWLLGEVHYARRAVPESMDDPHIQRALPFFERARGTIPAVYGRWIYLFQTVNPNAPQSAEALRIVQAPNSPVRWMLTKRALAQQHGQAALTP
jgi:hypothetical protein